jgi:hypothetical protein
MRESPGLGHSHCKSPTLGKHFRQPTAYSVTLLRMELQTTRETYTAASLIVICPVDNAPCFVAAAKFEWQIQPKTALVPLLA